MSLVSDGQFGNLDSSSRSAPNENILLDYTTKDMPVDIKELFDLVEYLAFNSGQVVSAIKKLTEFPITTPVFNTKNGKLKEKHEEIAKLVKYKSVALNVGFDYNMYGNSITSVYRPFVRHIKCPNESCGRILVLRDSSFEYHIKEDQFYLKHCPNCGSSGIGEIVDKKDKDPKKINIIRWNLKDIDIEYNEFTGKSYYYYRMPEQRKRLVRNQDIETLCTWPRQLFPMATKDDKFRFLFSDDFVYHMKTPNLCGISKVWGFPPPTPALKSFFYQFALRKANEAVALDYMNHLRVIYPAMSQANNDPLKYINLSTWADEMTSTVRKWRMDRNFIKLSPHPIGYQALGGEGRSLLLTNEIREASYDILMTIGIPRELMEGSSAQNLASPVLLRIVENMMLTYMEQLKDWLNWIDKKVSDWVELEHVPVDFVPFKFIDDIQRKQQLMAWGQGGDAVKISDTTIAEQLDIKLEQEEDKIIEDKIRQYKLQKKIQDKIQELESSLAEKAQRSSQEGQADYNNQQQTIGQADQMAMQLYQIPYEQRKSELLSLQKEDYVMYSIVIQRLEDLHRRNLNSASEQVAKTGSEKSNEVIPLIKASDRITKLASLTREYPKGHFDAPILQGEQEKFAVKMASITVTEGNK